MAVVFLIGGTGNQLFQYAASHNKDKFSGFFLGKRVRRLLNWTNHEEVFHYPQPHFLKWLAAAAALSLDLPLAKMTGKSLFSTFDTKSISARPLWFEVARLGYFQTAPERRSLAPLSLQLATAVEEEKIVVHVRGGDLLKLEQEGKNVYGFLNDAYYRTGIQTALNRLKASGKMETMILILTDDPKYACSLNLRFNGEMEPKIVRYPLHETLAVAVGAGWFVSSNSTLAYWIIRLREGRSSIAPKPFQKRGDYELPDAAERILFKYL